MTEKEQNSFGAVNDPRASGVIRISIARGVTSQPPARCSYNYFREEAKGEPATTDVKFQE